MSTTGACSGSIAAYFLTMAPSWTEPGRPSVRPMPTGGTREWANRGSHEGILRSDGKAKAPARPAS